MSPKTRRKEKDKRSEQRENRREANERLDLDPNDTENEDVTVGNVLNETTSTPSFPHTSTVQITQISQGAPYSNFDRRLTDLENRFDNKLATNLAETQARLENNIRKMGETIVNSMKSASQKSSQPDVSNDPTVLGQFRIVAKSPIRRCIHPE